MESILRQAFPGATVDFTTRVSESVLARLHFVVRVPAGESHPVDRRGGPRAPARRRHPHVGRGPRRGRCAPSTARRRRARAGRSLRPGLPRGLQGGLHARASAWPTSATWTRSRATTSTGLEHVPGARRARRRAPVQALPPQPAVADRRCCRCSPTWASRSSTSGPTRSPAATASTCRSTTSACACATTRCGPATAARDQAARAVPGRGRRGLARPRRVRRLQRARPRGRADLAPGRHPAHRRQVPAPDRLDLLAGLRRVRARRPTSASRGKLVDAVRDPVRPRAGMPATAGPRARGRRRGALCEPDHQATSTRSRASTTTASSGPSSA